MDHEDQIDTVLARLPEEYKSIVDQIEGRETAPSITELHEKLLNHEAKLLSASPSPQTPFLISVNLFHKKNQPINTSNHNKGRQHYNYFNPQSRPINNTNWQHQQQ